MHIGRKLGRKVGVLLFLAVAIVAVVAVLVVRSDVSINELLGGSFFKSMKIMNLRPNVADLATQSSSAKTNLELFHVDENGLKVTATNASFNTLNMASDDFAVFRGSGMGDFSALGSSLLNKYDVTELKRYPFLILAKENPSTLFPKKGFSILGGSQGGDLCGVPQKPGKKGEIGRIMPDAGKQRRSKIGGKKTGAEFSLFGSCNPDDCKKGDDKGNDDNSGDLTAAGGSAAGGSVSKGSAVRGSAEGGSAAERARGMVAEDVVDEAGLSSEQHDQRVGDAYGRKQEANRNLREAQGRVRTTERELENAQNESGEGGWGEGPTTPEQQERIDNAQRDYDRALAERNQARTDAKDASDRLEAAKDARDEARNQEREAAENEADKTDDGWEQEDGESTSCIDQMECGDLRRRARKAIKNLTKEDIERLLTDKRARPSSEGGFEAGPGSGLRGIDVFGQPLDETGFHGLFGQNGALDMCGANILILTKNMMVCDENPQGEEKPACSRPTGRQEEDGATQIPVGMFLMLKNMAGGSR